MNRNSCLSIENKILSFKVIFHAPPMWTKSASCHIGKLQIAQNKLLKLIFNLPLVPWFFSTARLHTIANNKLVTLKLQRLTSNFYSRCIGSEYPYINDLTSA